MSYQDERDYDEERYNAMILAEETSLCILEGHDVQYCLDHNACIAQWDKHDEGNHANCHPEVCDA